MNSVLFYMGAVLIFLWGIGHLIPTRNIVAGFGSLSEDNRRIIIMEWIAEGLTLCFIGLLVVITLVAAGPSSQAVVIVGRSCAGMLLAMAALSFLTGARTSLLPMRLCPIIKSLVAFLFLIATY